MSARIADNNGWFEIPANPLSKVGVFDYLGSSINAPEPNRIYKVYRPADELGSPDTLNSFRLVPLVDNHTMLGKSKNSGKVYMPVEQKGAHGTTGDNIWFDTIDGLIRGNIKVWSNNMASAIDAGKVDLSLGYHCKYDWTPGVYNGVAYDCVQRQIRGNHVANVDDGRMGDVVSVMDGIESVETVTFDAKDLIMTEKTVEKTLKERNAKAHNAFVKFLVTRYSTKPGKELPTMDAIDTAAMESEPTLADVVSIISDVMPQIAAINEAMMPAIDPNDGMEAVLDAAGQPTMDAEGKPVMKKKEPAATATVDNKDIKAVDIATMDAAIQKATKPLLEEIKALRSANPVGAFVSEIAKRDKLAKELGPFVGTFDHSDMTLQGVAEYGVKKLEIPVSAGQEVSAISAYLHGRTPSQVTHGVGMDGSTKLKTGENSSVAAYLSGDAK